MSALIIFFSVAGLWYFLPHHKLPHRADVQTQTCWLCYSLHGGNWQGDIRDETGSQCPSQRMCHGILEEGE